MWNFENKYILELDCHYSRIIASWLNSGKEISPRLKKLGKHRYKILKSNFELWLESLGLSEEQVKEIYEMATNGKLELENSASTFECLPEAE